MHGNLVGTRSEAFRCDLYKELCKFSYVKSCRVGRSGGPNAPAILVMGVGGVLEMCMCV